MARVDKETLNPITEQLICIVASVKKACWMGTLSSADSILVSGTRMYYSCEFVLVIWEPARLIQSWCLGLE